MAGLAGARAGSCEAVALGGALRAKKMRFFSERASYAQRTHSGRTTVGRGSNSKLARIEVVHRRRRHHRRRVSYYMRNIYTLRHTHTFHIHVYPCAVLIKIFLDRRRKFWILRKVT